MIDKKRKHAITLPFYENNIVLHPDGSFLSFINNKRADKFLEYNRATLISTDEKGNRNIMLNFEPRREHAVTDFDKSQRIDQCVVSGAKEDLSKHHVIPELLRQYMPLGYKSHNSHDVLLLHVDLHQYYENTYAEQFLNRLAVEMNIDTLRQHNHKHLESLKPIKIAASLLKHHDQIPDENVLNMKRRFIALTGLLPTTKILEYYASQYNEGKQALTYGEYFMSNVTDIDELCKRWREDFVKSMNPLFLPNGWSINGNKDYRNEYSH